jgi:hypothetical protein
VQTLLQWKSNNIAYSKCLYVALGIQNTMRMRDIVICDLRGSAVFFHIISGTVKFLKEKKLLNIKCI